MEVKVYTIKFSPPTWLRYVILYAALPMSVTLAGAVAVRAGVTLTTFNAGDPIRANEVNDNFAALNDAVTALQAQVTPPGTVIAFAGPVVPAGWLLCDGSVKSRTEYAALFQAIGTSHGSGDGASTFNLPDYRGRFLRGVDDGAARDSESTTRRAAATGGNVGDAVGSVEDDAFQGWKPQIITRNGSNSASLSTDTDYVLYSANTNTNGVQGTIVFRDDTYGFLAFKSYGTPRVSSETRPQNASVNYVVKY